MEVEGLQLWSLRVLALTRHSLTVCEGGCCIQGGVDEGAWQVWHRVQRHMSVDMGVQVQRRVRRLLWAQELMARGEGSSCHC